MSSRASDRRRPAPGRASDPPRRRHDGTGGWDGEPDPRGRPRRRGAHLGPIAITPVRVILLVALLGGLAFLGYSMFVRDALQVPLMASGMAVVGLVFAAMALLALLSVVRAGQERRDGAAVITALVGGLLAVASLMALAGAVIMGLIWSGTKAV